MYSHVDVIRPSAERLVSDPTRVKATHLVPHHSITPPRSPHTIPPPQGNPAPSTPKETYMCEFCSLSTPHVHGRDASDLSFSGFFSPGCIEIAVKKGLAARAANGGTDDAEVSDDDTDGT